MRLSSWDSFLGTFFFAKLRKATISFDISVCVCVCPYARTEQFASQWTDFHENLYFSIVRNSVEEIQVSLKSDTNTSIFSEDQHIISIISRSVRLRMKNISEKTVEKLETHIVSNNFSKNRAFYETIWKNSVNRGRKQMTIWLMRIGCWITKATNTHSECVIPITFPLQQWLHERPSMLCYTYIAYLV